MLALKTIVATFSVSSAYTNRIFIVIKISIYASPYCLAVDPPKTVICGTFTIVDCVVYSNVMRPNFLCPRPFLCRCLVNTANFMLRWPPYCFVECMSLFCFPDEFSYEVSFSLAYKLTWMCHKYSYCVYFFL